MFAIARHVTLAPTAVRNCRRVNLEPIAGTLHYSRALVDNLVYLIQAVQMARLGSADGQSGHHSPNIGGSVRSEKTITEANGQPMPKVVCSSISHQKLSSGVADKPPGEA